MVPALVPAMAAIDSSRVDPGYSPRSRRRIRWVRFFRSAAAL